MSDTNTLVTRRQFCAGACMASCATLATLATACGDGSPTSPSSQPTMLPVLAGELANSTVRVTTTGTALANVGGAARVESTAGLFLIAQTSPGSFTTIDGVCTHEGCTITGGDGDIYVCPCHGSRYNRTGQVQEGPARSSLRQYQSTFADGILTIRL